MAKAFYGRAGRRVSGVWPCLPAGRYLVPVVFLFCSCSNLKYLPEGSSLYTGAEVEVVPVGEKATKAGKELAEELKEKTRPRQNKKLLGMRIKLWFYNIAGEPKGKGLKHLLRNKWGEPPVLTSDVNLSLNNNVLQSYLVSKGYLQARVEGDTSVNNRKGKALYKATPRQRYKIREVHFPDSTSSATTLISRSAAATLLKPGDYYDLDVMKAERQRIDNYLKNHGYFYFNEDYILLDADSTIGNHEVNLYVTLKDHTPERALHTYRMKNIHIYPDYSLMRDSALMETSPVMHNDFSIVDPEKKFKPWVFDRIIYFRNEQYYDRVKHDRSLNRLVNLGTFRYINAEFEPHGNPKNRELDVTFLLTPSKKNTLSASITGTSKSNNFVGSEIQVNLTNRNVFRGAEQLTMGISGGFEQQISGQQTGVSSYSLQGDATLTFPRFLIPFFKFDIASSFVPRTQISANYQLLSRAQYYKLHSFTTQYGYNWKESIRKEHTLNPAFISYIQPLSTTPQFEELLNRDPTLRRNFDPQFIIGSNYTFTYNDRVDDGKKFNFYFQGGLEAAGNLLGLLVPRSEETGTRNIFGTPFSQYIRLETDTRFYLNLGENTVWANRLIAGVGYSHGNSDQLPFVKQFFAGGVNDIRAFPARALGPGSYPLPEKTLFADQSGDIKLMFNTEFRGQLLGPIHGAVFVDAGNIWLWNESPNKPGSGFSRERFLKEMAVGTGVGLRIDASILLVRLDLAFPLRIPSLPEGQRWVIDQIDFGSKTWRRDNLIWNLAIGYPF